MDIVVWLRSLGLGEYEAAFRDNEIDESGPPDLTHEHLKELGRPVGHRLKLLEAIAALRCRCRAASAFRRRSDYVDRPRAHLPKTAPSVAK